MATVSLILSWLRNEKSKHVLWFTPNGEVKISTQFNTIHPSVVTQLTNDFHLMRLEENFTGVNFLGTRAKFKRNPSSSCWPVLEEKTLVSSEHQKHLFGYGCRRLTNWKSIYRLCQDSHLENKCARPKETCQSWKIDGSFIDPVQVLCSALLCGRLTSINEISTQEAYISTSLI